MLHHVPVPISVVVVECVQVEKVSLEFLSSPSVQLSNCPYLHRLEQVSVEKEEHRGVAVVVVVVVVGNIVVQEEQRELEEEQRESSCIRY